MSMSSSSREEMGRDPRPNVAVRHIAPLVLLVAIALVGLGFLIIIQTAC